MSSILAIRNKISSLLGKTFGGSRDLYNVFGYKKTLRAEDFMAMYFRNDIAQRVIRAYPQATWRDMPNIKTEDERFTDEFEKFYNEKRLGHYFERADRLASIGHFGLLFMGFQDGKSVSEPLEKGDYPLLFLSPYSEDNINVTQWNFNSQSPRYGLPETYTVQTGNSLIREQTQTRSMNVHHSRVIHIAELLNDDEVYAIPRLMAIYNRLEDLEKVVGGSAEMFWLAANRGLLLKAAADAQFDEKDRDDLKEQAEEYQHQLRRIMTMQGVDVETLSSETPDPSKNVEVLINLISGTTAIPKRILIGNEAGELASSQDETNWNSRVDERRNTFAAPSIVRPFIDKMMLTGNLPQLDDFDVYWDESEALSEKEIAEIQEKRANAIDKLDRVGVISLEQAIRDYRPEWSEDKVKEEIQRISKQVDIPVNGVGV